MIAGCLLKTHLVEYMARTTAAAAATTTRHVVCRLYDAGYNMLQLLANIVVGKRRLRREYWCSRVIVSYITMLVSSSRRDDDAHTRILYGHVLEKA
jgi:hypothetical protein